MPSFASAAIFILIYLVTITVHEFSHGCVAYFFGDRTAKERGRLSLNPFRHVDPLWTLLLPMVLLAVGLPAIGMARPVPVNFSRLRSPKSDMIWVALAGPFANIILAFLLAVAYRQIGSEIFLMGVYFNLGLAIFNLVPIPPLDGSRVLMGLLPVTWAYGYAKMEKFGFLVILLLVWMRVIWHVVVPGINFFCHLWRLPAL